MSKFRVSDDDGLWVVDEVGTEKWWTVSSNIDNEPLVTSAKGRVVKYDSASYRQIVKAVHTHISKEKDA